MPTRLLRRESLDDNPPRTRRRRSSWFSALLFGGALLCAACALAMFVPVPGLSYSLMLGTWGLDALALLAVATVLAAVALRRRPGRARAAAVVLLALSLLAVGGVGAVQIHFASARGVSLDALALTGIGQVGSAPDVVETFLDDSATDQSLEAGIWLPRDPGTGEPRATSAGAPVVVLLHGGGWMTGDHLNPMTRGQADWFAEQGYLAIALDYPLSTPSLQTWELAETRVGCGLAWVGAHAVQYGGDVNRLALVGDSAGGHLALETAARQVLGTVRSSCGGEVPPVDAVSLTYPIADPVVFHDNPDLVIAPYVRLRAQRYTGGTPAELPERYAEINPVAKIEQIGRMGLGRRMPPVLVVHGEQDHVVPVVGSRELDAALEAAGVEHETVVVPFADHVLDLNAGSVSSQLWRRLTLEIFARTGLEA
ncbi:MAG: alpha/beta hydrolase [Actinomyces sp.]|uniref:alpha/beta hydrolase n=1 Tax=Actinomyces sp. TaxID=29317 RepID=UPI0026DB1CA4|nr:alpha/beta hydrolase [Actinomyces sp.]MDO4243152.1 alpha/beta hydrolase [Actinomyces sp.]